MVTKKEVFDLFKPTPNQNSSNKGNAGFDNPRENIDPHIKTKVVSSSEIIASKFKLLSGATVSNLVLTADTDGNARWAEGGASIGSTVTNGTDDSILFISGTTLQQDNPSFIYNNSTKQMNLSGAMRISGTVYINHGTAATQLTIDSPSDNAGITFANAGSGRISMNQAGGQLVIDSVGLFRGLQVNADPDASGVNALAVNPTFNTGGTILYGINVNATDTASHADSQLLNLSTDSKSLHRVYKNGDTHISGATRISGTAYVRNNLTVGGQAHVSNFLYLDGLGSNAYFAWVGGDISTDKNLVVPIYRFSTGVGEIKGTGTSGVNISGGTILSGSLFIRDDTTARRVSGTTLEAANGFTGTGIYTTFTISGGIVIDAT